MCRRGCSPEKRQGKAIVWNATTKQPVFPPLTLPYAVRDGLFLDGGRRFLTVMEVVNYVRKPLGFQVEARSELKVWSSEDGRPLGDGLSLNLVGIHLARNTGGDRLLLRGHLMPGMSSTAPDTIEVRDARSLERILPRAEDVFGDACFSPDGLLLAAVLGEFREFRSLNRQQSPPPGVRVSADGRRWSYPSKGPSARLYKSGTGEPASESMNHELPIERVTFAPTARSSSPRAGTPCGSGKSRPAGRW